MLCIDLNNITKYDHINNADFNKKNIEYMRIQDNTNLGFNNYKNYGATDKINEKEKKDKCLSVNRPNYYVGDNGKRNVCLNINSYDLSSSIDNEKEKFMKKK